MFQVVCSLYSLILCMNSNILGILQNYLLWLPVKSFIERMKKTCTALSCTVLLTVIWTTFLLKMKCSFLTFFLCKFTINLFFFLKMHTLCFIFTSVDIGELCSFEISKISKCIDLPSSGKIWIICDTNNISI